MGIFQQNTANSISILVKDFIEFVIIRITILIPMAVRHLVKCLSTLKVRMENVLFSDYQIQQKDCLCTSYVLFII